MVGKAGIRKVTSVDFSVTTVMHAALSYEALDNHDVEGDSDGTTIKVLRDGNQSPTASFMPSCSGLSCDFNGTASSDPDGTIVGYDWDFGDGAIGTGATTSHTYASEGTYTVVLTVFDDMGASGSDSQQVTVSESGGGTAHVAGLDGQGLPGRRDRWDAIVTITVHDQNHLPLANAEVTGSWSDGATGSMSCTTDATGQCSITKGNLKSSVGSVTFTVDDVLHTTYSYNPSDNHDPVSATPFVVIYGP
jgi:PKD repeat protein